MPPNAQEADSEITVSSACAASGPYAGQRQRDFSLWTPVLRCGGEKGALLLLMHTASPRQKDGGAKGAAAVKIDCAQV